MGQRDRPEPHPVPGALRGRPRQRQVAHDLHPPHRPRRLRGDACRRQPEQAGRGRRAAGQCAAAAGARRLPLAHPHVDDRGRDALSQPGQPRALRRPAAHHRLFRQPGRARRADRDAARQGPAGRLPGAPVRRRRQGLLGLHLRPADRVPGPPGHRFQHHQHHRHDPCPGGDAAGQRAPGGRDRIAGRRVRPLRQERLPGAGQQPLPHDACLERRRAGAGRQLVRLPARDGRAAAVSGGARKDRRVAGGAGARPPRVPPAGVPAHRRRLVLRLQLPDPRGRLRGHAGGHHRAQARRAGRQGGGRAGPQGAGGLPGQHPDDARP